MMVTASMNDTLQMQSLWDDGERVFCRGRFSGEEGDRAVLISRLANESHPSGGLARLTNEFSLRDELDSAWALRPIDLIREGGRTLLLLEDPGGRPLAALLGQPLDLQYCLQLGVGIAAALSKLHQRDLVHKDIKPAHLLIDCEDGHVRLTGFGLTSRLPRERQAPKPPETIAGTLAYMAPEQTGRMNRSIDSRSDLYSFGITFYQMLTGSLPFCATDPMEWVHCHIARKALAPDALVQSIPAAVSQIVMKLLAKTPEERYQTAAGVEFDLRQCLLAWQEQGRIDEFLLDNHGTPYRLLIPEKLYGRDRDVETLLAAFDRVVKGGPPEWVLVAGYSGIGKSAVVNELHRMLVPPRGLFASGKFDQYQRDRPYSTLVQAFQTLVQTLMGKPDAELARWRDELIETLTPNARLMTDLIPELKLIMGEPGPVPVLEPQQAQRRFLLVFRRFISVFARAEHPLALFLDDLQWLDMATLDLLEELLTSADIRHLLVIGAYRNNEVDRLHPLMTKLEAVREAGVRVDDVTLAPLGEEHVLLLVTEALRGDPLRTAPLARLIQEKTAGNPFFVIQFLQTLADEHLLHFDHDARQWCWDSDRIHAKGYTDNVVDLMVGKLTRLSDETRHALEQLACLGNAARASTLATVLDIPQPHVHSVLWDAFRQELVERLDGGYTFAHDRVHEAAYSLIPHDHRARSHLHIGRLLAAQMDLDLHQDAIFEVVGQLNRGAALIRDAAEREQLAHYNLLAGQRAKAATAYVSALAYLVAGLELLEEDIWERRYGLIFALELNRAECEFLTGQLASAHGRLEWLAGRARTLTDRVSVACLHMDVCLVLDRNDEAIKVCLTFLRHVGIDWRINPGDDEVHAEYNLIWTLMQGRTIEDLVELPAMENEVALATIRALISFFSPALHTNENLGCLAICKAVTLSLEFGNSDASSVAYANIPRIVGRRFGDYQAGFRFGLLGCELVERGVLERYKPRTCLCYSIFVTRWSKPVRSCRAQLLRAFDTASRIGDLPYGAFARNSLVSNMLFTAQPLADVQAEAERGLEYARKIRFGLVINFIENQLALIRMLRGSSPIFGRLDDDAFNEGRIEGRLRQPSLLFETWYWVRKMQARFLAGQYEEAIEAGAKARPLLWTSYGFLEEAEFCFYDALARAAWCNSASVEERKSQHEIITRHHRDLQSWAELCQENFASQTALVEAELARLENRLICAQSLYDRAIQLAQESGFFHVEALANELASRLYAELGLAKIAQLYLQDARYGYLRWGADGKVQQLESRFPSLRAQDVEPRPTSTIASPVEHLDLATVLKVSQAASSEIVLEKLVDTIMHTAIEQAGAERGLLILHNGSEYRVSAEATTDDQSTHLRDSAVTSAILPESVLNNVLRTQESVCLDEATANPAFAADPYLTHKRARSILCLPLIHQGKLSGALYLENNLVVGAFSPARIAVLKLVASQAAISLENARLYRDVAEREAKIRRLVDANIIGILVWTSDGDIIEANDAFLRMVKYSREEVLCGSLRWRDLTPPEFKAISESSMIEAVQSGKAKPFEKEYFRKDGTRLPVIVGLAIYEVGQKEGVAFVLDLTERKQAEETIRNSERRFREVQSDLAHANRVATMGQLVASIAHEVSQPIASSLASANAAQRWLAMVPPVLGEVQQSLARIIKDSNRAAAVLGRIRGLIRKAPPQKGPMDVNSAIREVVELTHGQAIKKGVSVTLALGEQLPAVIGDRVELQQVLLNLAVNAIEAMSDGSCKERTLNINTMLDAQGCLLVSVSDTGPGFASETPEHVFEPFFTTKPTGLGMGLSICRSIIEAHGGRLWASANTERGALIQFTLKTADSTFDLAR
jgi:PAS domain S-box-containing protein